YQGVTGNLEPDFIEALQRIAVNAVVPDCTLILDLPAAIGLERARRRGGTAGVTGPDRFEKEKIETHEKRRLAFLDIAAREPARCHVIDATQPEEAIAAQILAVVEGMLSGHALLGAGAEPAR